MSDSTQPEIPKTPTVQEGVRVIDYATPSGDWLIISPNGETFWLSRNHAEMIFEGFETDE